MKIKKIDVFQKELKVVNGPYVFSGGTMDALTTTLVRLTTDNGIEGWGETCPLGPTYQPNHSLGALAAIQELAPKLVGQESLPNVLRDTMSRFLEGHNYAKAAFDIAVYDILGKTLDQPVHALLGGALTQSIPSYYAISMVSPEETARTVIAKQREGYKALQIKIGCGDIRQDAEVLKSAYAVLGPGVKLAADANRALTTSEAIQLSNLIFDIPVAFEQPCNSLHEIEGLRGRLNHPIYLDEAAINVETVMTAFGRGFCDGLGMKVTRAGGLSPMIAIRDMALASRKHMSVDDSWGGDIIAAACVHMGATVDPRLFRATWLAAPYIEEHYDPKNGISIVNGMIDVPERSGLGPIPDVDQLGYPVFTA
jgi:4-hydroxyproline betaine 2-epimerase